MNRPPEHYDAGVMLLHWGVALLILCATLSSFFLNTAFADNAAITIRSLHNVTGTLALGLVIVWFGWRALHAELPKFATIGSGEHWFMDITNGTLNVLLLLVPVTGILHLFALGKSIDLGMFQLSYAVSMSRENVDLTRLTHNVLGKLLLAVAILHSAHALWHHFGKQDELVRRMLPWTSK
jgi:cytochrome b561